MNSKFPYSKVIYTLIIISVLVGILVLIGWKSENNFLKTSGLGTLAMKPNSAFLFILSGITLFLLQLKNNNINLFIIRFLSVIIFLIGSLSFLQHHFIINFGIDELLIKNKNGIANSIRMTSTAAFNFILIGLSLFLVSFQQFKKTILPNIFVYTVLTLSLISISAHFLGQIDLVNFTIFTFMSYSTSIIFMIVSIGIIITVYKDPTIISSIERKLYAGLIVSIIFILFIVSTSINSIQSFIVLSKKIDQIEIKKIELDKILIETHDLTANTNGFVISHEENFLDQLSQNKVAINESINQLELLSKNSPTQLTLLKELKLLLKERIDYADYIINKSLYTQLSDDDEVFLTIEGERLTHKADDFIIKMLEEENRQYKEYTLLEIKNSDNTKKIIYIGAVAQFLLLFLIYMFVTKDISGRRKVEKSLQELNENLDEKVKERTLTLKESEEHFRYNLDNMLEGCQIINFDWQYIYLNKAAEKQNKRSNDSLIGKVIMNEWPGIDTTEVFKMMKLSMESRISSQNDVEFIFPDGSKEWFDVSIDPTPQGIFIRSQNITERKHAVEKILNINTELEQKVKIRTNQLEEINTKLNEAKLEAEKANLAKSEFLSRMSHELRTPLNSILGFAQLLEMNELKPTQKKGVNNILKSGKYLLNLINEVLDLSRIEAGELTISLEPILLKEIISESLDIIHPIADKKAIKIEVETTDLHKYVLADHQKLKQVLLNLLNNAVKYNKENGLITIKIIYNNKKVKIYVTDTGNGIATENIPKLFNPFQRFGEEISIIEGTGLGLAVSKKLMNAMNGSIGVESEIGNGSTFWIELPKIENHNEINQHKDNFLSNKTENLNINGTLLYIEDNISNQQLVKQIIDTQRPKVNLYIDTFGLNAIKFAIEYKPNIIILDLDLPDIHGSKVLKLLQENPKTNTIPVIVLSADVTDKQLKNIMSLGAKAYIGKPFNIHEFLKVIDEYLKG